MNDAYLAAIFDECGTISMPPSRNGNALVHFYVHNSGLAEALKEWLGGSLKPNVHDGRTTSYRVTVAHRKKIMRLCKMILPHTQREPVVKALMDHVTELPYSKGEERQEKIRYFKMRLDRWLAG